MINIRNKRLYIWVRKRNLSSFSGMYILAGFSDKLRLMNLLIDDIKTFREFHVRNCTACAFSCGGHLLAAVSHNQISVFSSVDFRNTVSNSCIDK